MTMLNIGVREILRGKYSDLFRAVLLAVFALCVGFICMSLLAGCGGFFGWFRWLLGWLWLRGDSGRPAGSLSLYGLSILSDFGCGFAGHN